MRIGAVGSDHAARTRARAWSAATEWDLDWHPRALVPRFRLSLPGKGGVDRGPAPAELTFGKPTEETKHDFKEQALPPGAVADLKQSKLQGVSPSAPKVEPGGTASSGALAGAASGSGSANTQVVLPRHKVAVERYFERPPRSPK